MKDAQNKALEAAQSAEALAREEARLKALEPATAPVTTPKVVNTNAVFGVWSALAQCESGGNWAINTSNGFYGGLQFDIGTWGGYGGFARADLAPPEIQVAKAEIVRSARGFSPWPQCASRLGLL